MAHNDYPLHEFALRLAAVEEKYAKELFGVIECFTNSRLDLPIKRLEDVSKARSKTARHLKKCVDPKKNEAVNLWKLSNIYSATAVDVDTSMREIRNNLRKSLKKEISNAKDVSAFRRFVDEYRPANRKAVEPQEIYDTNRPTLKEKQRFLDLFKREKKDERKVPLHEAELSYTQHLVDSAKQASQQSDSMRIRQRAPSPVARPTTLPPAPAPQAPAPEQKTAPRPVSAQPVSEEKPVAAPRKKTQPPATTRTESHRRKNPAPPPPAKDQKPTELMRSNVRKEDQLPATVINLEDNCTGKTAPIERVNEGVLAEKHSIQISGGSSDEDTAKTIGYSTQYPRITEGRIQRFHSQAMPARPRLQAQYVVSNLSSDTEEPSSIHRL